MGRPNSTVDTPLPEIRIPTRLVQRSPVSGRTQEARIIAPGVLPLVRVGPYDVVRGLVRAPSAWMAEARGPNGEAVLLQLAHLRPVHGKVDLLHRQHLERALAQATAELFSEAEFAIMAHGGADRDDGSRVLFWALPWRPDAERLTNAALYVEGPAHLVKIGIALAQRLARRHGLGRLEPLLSEALVLVEPEGAELCGVPVQVPPAWLSPDTPNARLAPEETANEDVTKVGDVWRLGQTLMALASSFDAMPHALVQLLERMTATDPRLRPPRITEVLVELESIHHDLDRGLELVRLEAAGTSTFSALEPEELGQLLVRCLGDSTKVDSAHPWRGDSGPVPFISSPPTEEMLAPPNMPEVPPWAFFFDRSQLLVFLELVANDVARRGLEHQVGTGVIQISGQAGTALRYLGLSDLARLCHRHEPKEWATLIARDFDALLAEAPTFDPDLAPTVLRVESTLEVIRRPRKTPPPDLTPTPQLQHERTIPTPALEIPPPPAVVRVVMGQPGPILGVPAPAPTPAPFRVPEPELSPIQRRLSEATLIDGNSAGPLTPELAAAAQNRSMKVSALVASAILLVGAVLAIARLVEPGPLLATPAHEVVVDASPADAVVVSERDGRVLGPVPQRFLIPQGTAPVVLIAAPGHEPTRLVLPERGRVAANLTPLPATIDSCALAVSTKDQALYEGVAARIERDGRLVVRGAAVVRAKTGAGAWLVRCPKLGGSGMVALEQDPVPEVLVQVIAPAAAEVSIDGGRLGTTPVEARVRGAFVEVQITTAEGERISRWVPTLAPTEVQMPSTSGPTALLGLGN